MQRDEDTRVGGVDLWGMVATDPEVVGGGSAGGKEKQMGWLPLCV